MLIAVDVGTGSGLWAMEVAEEFPTARVIGTDISPTQPTDDLPPNCEFRLESALDGLNLDDNSVDLLHSRLTSVKKIDVVDGLCWVSLLITGHSISAKHFEY